MQIDDGLKKKTESAIHPSDIIDEAFSLLPEFINGD